MKVLVISDIHGNTENIEKLADKFGQADFVLFGGDFSKFGDTKTAKPALESLTKRHESIFAVLGNCDEKDFISEIEEADISVQGSMVFHDDFIIAGSGGGSKFTGETPFERDEQELCDDFKIVKDSIGQIGDKDGHVNNLILIMHNPPKDTKTDTISNGMHVGSELLRKFIEDVQPLLVVTGHIHESAGIDKIGETTVINPGALFEGNYGWIELEKNSGKWNVKSAELCTL